MAKGKIPSPIVLIIKKENKMIRRELAFALLTLPAIASRAWSRYSAVRPVSLGAHGKSFRESPLHCSGRSDPSRQEHVGPHLGRASQRAAPDGARGKPVPAGVLQRRAGRRLPGTIRVS